MLMQISCEACLHLFLPNFEYCAVGIIVVPLPTLFTNLILYTNVKDCFINGCRYDGFEC